MPSPVGHVLAGVAAAWFAGGRLPAGWHRTIFPVRTRTSLPSVNLTALPAEVVLFSAAAIAPDLDLLFGTHSTYTHSVGAVTLVFVLALLIAGTRHWRIAVAIAAAWGSHLLLDWLGSDTSPPIGIMARWPFDAGFYQSPISIFDAISRRYWLPEQFIAGNLRAAAKEILILGPFFAVALALRRRRAG
jgi:hypothetical protein